MTWRAATLALVAGLGGCAYYNGLWRANRLAREAERAARDGRVGEARSLWAQAATRAESVSVRHPDSRWTDDALLLRGRALRELGQCGAALQPLERARVTSPDRSVRETAAVLAAGCHLELGDAHRALAVSASAVASPDRTRASEARYWRGRAAQSLGDHPSAERDLAASAEPDAAAWRAVSLAELGEVAALQPILDSLLARGATEAQWHTILSALASSRPSEASRVLAVIDSAPAVPLDHGAPARLYLVAGRAALSHRDSANAERWWLEAGRGTDSVAAREAAIALVTLDVARAATKADFLTLAARLDTLAGSGGPGAREAAQRASQARRVAGAVTEPGALLLQAETARDSLSAGRLARSLFFEVATRWPESLFVPKALLAAAALTPAAQDSLVQLVTERYPGSPYVLAFGGRAPAAFQALEDSLLTLSGASRPAAVERADPGRRPVRTGPKSVPLPDEIPTRRRG